jgi:hypothetical protein
VMSEGEAFGSDWNVALTSLMAVQWRRRVEAIDTGMIWSCWHSPFVSELHAVIISWYRYRILLMLAFCIHFPADMPMISRRDAMVPFRRYYDISDGDVTVSVMPSVPPMQIWSDDASDRLVITLFVIKCYFSNREAHLQMTQCVKQYVYSTLFSVNGWYMGKYEGSWENRLLWLSNYFLLEAGMLSLGCCLLNCLSPPRPVHDLLMICWPDAFILLPAYIRARWCMWCSCHLVFVEIILYIHSY